MANPVGRPPKFSNPEELETVYEKWREEFKLGGRKFGEVPDVEGFCDYVDMWRDKFSEYGNKPEFHDTIKRIKNWIYYRKKQLAFGGKMNPAIFIFDAKNNAGYVDKQELEQSGEIKHTYEELDDEQLERALKARKDRIA